MILWVWPAARTSSTTDGKRPTLSSQTFFSEFLSYRLNVLAEVAIESGEDVFGELVGVSIREMRTLRIVAANPGIHFVEIVRATRLDRSLVSRLIQNLLKSSLIERHGTPDDARKYRLFVTDHGRERCARSEAITRAFERLMLTPLSTEDAQALNNTIDVLGAWIGSEEYASRVKALKAELRATKWPLLGSPAAGAASCSSAEGPSR